MLSKAREAVVRFLPEIFLGFFFLSLVPLLFVIGRSIVRQVIHLANDPSGYVTWLFRMPWTVAAAAVFVCGIGGLVYLIGRNWMPIWAVARKMIREAMHRKIVLVLLVFVAVLIPSLPFILKTEGRLSSQVQLVLLYSLSLSLILLSLLAIFLTTASVCSEVEQKHVHLTDPKPLLRWQFLLGKWLGVVVLCTAILVVMSSGTYALVMYLAREPAFGRMSPQKRGRAFAEQLELRRQVFTARKVVQAPLPDVSEQVDEEVKKAVAETPGGVTYWLRQELTRERLVKSQTAEPHGGSVLWRFSGLAPRQEEPIQVRFHAFNYGSGAIRRPCRFRPYHGEWTRRRKGDEKPSLKLVATGRAVYPPPAGWSNYGFHQFNLPASSIPPDGTLYLAFKNLGPESIVFDVDNPVEVLQKEEGFFLNYYRGVTILVFHVALLAALGLMAGSLFSFPVASLLVFCLFVGGLLASWYHSQFVEPTIWVEIPSTAAFYFDRLWRGFAELVLVMMPSFGSFSPLENVTNGRLVSGGDVATAGTVLLVLKGGAAMLIGMYFYGRKELARIVA